MVIRIENISERREETRMEFEKIALGEYEDDFTVSPFEGKALNIGQNGMLFESDMLVPQGTPVKITTEISGRPVVTSGTVVRVVPGANGMVKLGIQFGKLTEKALKLIDNEVRLLMTHFTPNLN